MAEGFHKLGINSDRLKQLVSQANTRVSSTDLEAKVSDLAPDWLLNRLPNESGELGGSKHDIID